MTGSRSFRHIACAAALAPVAVSAAGCAIGEDAVTNGPRAHHAPARGTAPGFIGDRAALLAFLMERLDADPSACEDRSLRRVRCRLVRDVGGPRAGETYVDVHVSRSGMLMTATGPGIDKLVHHYDNR